MILAPDENLLFDEQTHKYFYLGQELQSVTSYISQFKPPFDSHKAARRQASRLGTTPESILAQWAHKRNRAALLGSEVHALAELFTTQLDQAGRISYSNAFLHSLVLTYPQSLINALRDTRLLSSHYLPEYKVCNPDLGLAGTIDLLFGPHLEYLLDWKTNEELKFFGYRRMLDPFSHLEDCNFIHYCMQLNLYREILAANGHEIEIMYLAHLHNGPSYKIYSIPRMEISEISP